MVSPDSDSIVRMPLAISSLSWESKASSRLMLSLLKGLYCQKRGELSQAGKHPKAADRNRVRLGQLSRRWLWEQRNLWLSVGGSREFFADGVILALA